MIHIPTVFIGHEDAMNILQTDLRGIESLITLGQIKNHETLAPRKYRFDAHELLKLQNSLAADQFMFCQRRVAA